MGNDKTTIGEGKVFMSGNSQAVRLPKSFRLPGTRVRVSRVDGGILLLPIIEDVEAWFKAMDDAGGGDFLEEGREQPPMPPDQDLFD